MNKPNPRLDDSACLKGLERFEHFAKHAPYLTDPKQKRDRKLVDSLEEAIRRSGLKDGMTISFHHAFREGDKVINLVVETLARMGFKNLTLASSSLLSANAPLIEHIKSGVIRKIYTSGMRGQLAKAISNGLMEEPIHIHSHGGRARLVQTGELKIDVAFLGSAPATPSATPTARAARAAADPWATPRWTRSSPSAWCSSPRRSCPSPTPRPASARTRWTGSCRSSRWATPPRSAWAPPA